MLAGLSASKASSVAAGRHGRFHLPWLTANRKQDLDVTHRPIRLISSQILGGIHDARFTGAEHAEISSRSPTAKKPCEIRAALHCEPGGRHPPFAESRFLAERARHQGCCSLAVIRPIWFPSEQHARRGGAKPDQCMSFWRSARRCSHWIVARNSVENRISSVATAAMVGLSVSRTPLHI